MTDTMAALANLANNDCPERHAALACSMKNGRMILVMDKWLSIQAMSRLSNTLETVKALMHHPIFNIKNPNKVRALIGAFAQGNPVRFHDTSGKGYEFLAGQVIAIDPLNPQIAARLVSAFTLWKRYDEKHRALMKAQLERILKTPACRKMFTRSCQRAWLSHGWLKGGAYKRHG
jgi:aminopeptidase N